MNKLRWVLAGIVLFTVLMGLIVKFQDGVKDAYVPTADRTVFDASGEYNENGDLITVQHGGKSVGDRLSEITVIDALTDIQTLLNNFQTGSALDIIGGTINIIFGAVRSLFGVFSAPFEINTILGEYYTWYTVISYFVNILMLLMLLYVFFLLASGQTQQGGL